MTVGTGEWIRRFHPAPRAAAQLVCLAHAGGAASYFFPVSRALSPAVDVLAVQYPGRQERRREAPFEDAELLADAVAGQLAGLTDRPLALFGHSLGATVAFEVARRLEAVGTTPSALFVSGRTAPSRHRAQWVHLGDDERLLAEIVKMEGTEPAMLQDPELVRMILPALRSDYKAAETYRYRPGPPLRCPVVALTGDADPQVTEGEAGAWREHTTGPFELRVFPGGHFYLNHHAGEVVALIRQRLTAAAGNAPRP
ncbi:thioesterase II family protein [Streptomyces sp. IBSBF 3136]|uniref:thioesterase II family protein n=1 Tax=Streptomyces sp. IBSBF 3136 TaxID=2903524 RepID=UPI002FDC291B